ncbi:hypothetical protein [Alsobacter sp. R-9]
MTLADVSLALFSFFNVVRLGSYVPQIVRIARDRRGAEAIACSTWAMWFLANASTALYAQVNVADPKLAAINALNAACCATVIVLTQVKRHRWRQQSAAARLHPSTERRAAAPSSLQDAA